MDDFLKDQVFLDQLDSLKLKNQFVRITTLSWQEEPINQIQGKVISGSLNLNGSSSLRRTANLSIFAEEKENDLTQIDTDLSINRKIKLEIGIVNTVPKYLYKSIDNTTGSVEDKYIDYQQKYGKIIWFPLGIYVIFDPNISHGTNGVTISVSLKDKMCLLNGDAGGKIPACTEFHLREQEDENGVVTVDRPVLRQIIQECVQHWGNEDPAKIIIADVDDRIKQVMRWMGDDPLYYSERPVTESDTTGAGMYFLDFDEAVRWAGGSEDAVWRFEYGDEAGFILTDFIYPGELIGDAGETVTGVLDKIISVIGNFEYFYDVYGNFRFQEIKNFLNITYVTQMFKNRKQYTDAEGNYISNMTSVRNEPEVDYSMDLTGGKAAYTFQGSKLISSFANAPKYSNIKNDYVVWGVRKSPNGMEVPIRYHLAIDVRPDRQYDEETQEYYYQDHKHIIFYEDEYGVTRAKVWLRTTDEEEEQGVDFRTYDWREEIYMQGIEASSTGSHYPYYFTELLWEWPKLWDFEKHNFQDHVNMNPASIDFFIDLLDSGADVGKYNVQNIGRRSEIVSDDKINCVFEQEVPDVVILLREDEITDDDARAQMQADREECENLGQIYIQVESAIYDLLMMGGIQNSCYQRVCEMLYQFTNMKETVTINALPIYYLEPNMRVNVQDPSSGIFGDYMIQSISLPLSIDGTMSITASKALQKI